MSEPRRILVVDDEAIIVNFLRSLLGAGHATYEIRTASRGEEAVGAAAAFRPHLVVLDINIPGGGGLEACRAMRALPECAHSVVLSITSDPHPERIRQMREAGASECLAKPFALPEFLSKVEKYVEEGFRRESDAPSSHSS